jgi:hypothetical protein
MMPRSKKKLLQVGNILSVLLAIAVNALAVLLPLNGKTTQELSDKLPNFFVPAGLTFSIWGIIYILWVVFAIYQARDLLKKDEISMPFLSQITWLFVLTGIANSIWIFLWHYEYIGLSLFVMILLLVCLLAIYIRLKIGKTHVPLKEIICVHIPFSVYLGWISVATIANVTAFLISIQWDGFGIDQLTWTILIIAFGTLLTLLMLALRKDIMFSLVVLWAYLGIWLKRTAQPNTMTDMNVATTAAIALVLIFAGVIAVIGYQLMRRNKQKSVQTI